jgi:hypothetical protein
VVVHILLTFCPISFLLLHLSLILHQTKPIYTYQHNEAAFGTTPLLRSFESLWNHSLLKTYPSVLIDSKLKFLFITIIQSTRDLINTTIMLFNFAVVICSLQIALAAPTFSEPHFFAIDDSSANGKISCSPKHLTVL